MSIRHLFVIYYIQIFNKNERTLHDDKYGSEIKLHFRQSFTFAKNSICVPESRIKYSNPVVDASADGAAFLSFTDFIKNSVPIQAHLCSDSILGYVQ